MEKTIGGDRLGAGKKEKVYLNNYERSTHDLGYIWRSSMASGTLVPFMCKVALPGDTFDIKLNADIKTLPTVGPLFGSYKVQLDVFQIPVRLYQGKLHMNMLNIGLDMSKIKLPLMTLRATSPPVSGNIDNYQINSSSIFSYLGIRGLGYRGTSESSNRPYEVNRNFNAVPYLSYFDIYKQYYANKQEEIGIIIHNNLEINEIEVDTVKLYNSGVSVATLTSSETPTGGTSIVVNPSTELKVKYLSLSNLNIEGFFVATNGVNVKMIDLFSNWIQDDANNTIVFSEPITNTIIEFGSYWISNVAQSGDNIEPMLQKFPLSNIDSMRQRILSDVTNPSAFLINDADIEPYNLPFYQIGVETSQNGAIYSKTSAQEGLLIKTYQSDLFNNWISTEWIDGENGINAITSVDTTEGFFSIDTLQLSRKIYDMLNRIAISGGSYDDWLDATYTHERSKGMESPMYCGGLSKELTFEEIFSQSTVGDQPLGTLAGKGRMTDKHKGGNITIRVDEPSYIMGIISLTPRIDYSQGNSWDTGLKTLNDFHKPALDEIGFQDLLTDQMAWFDTALQAPYDQPMPPVYKSAGKQPAWINYMTSVNEVRGDFAVKTGEMFMVLNRRYDVEIRGNNLPLPTYKTGIKDLTTYIDPTKFNFIFANTKLNAMNFWAQVKCDITARRKMSAKVMPNL